LACLWQPLHAAEAVAVDVVRPDRGEVMRYVALPGTLVAERQATIYAKMPGYLRTLLVDKGDSVQQGQLLGELEMPELQADQARFLALVNVAKRDYERLSEARKQAPDLVVPQSVDEALGRLEIARADLKRTQQLLGYARLTAPFTGIVTMRYVDPGAYIPAATSGASASTAAIVTLMDISRLRVQIPVPEREAALIDSGEPVRLHTEGVKTPHVATISRFSHALDPETRTMLVEADLENAEQTLRPGMYANTEIGVEVHRGVLRVPSVAVRAERNASVVFVVRDDHAMRTVVRVGFNDGDHAEILDGLSGTESLAVPPANVQLTDGQSVRSLPR
jgi:RND family efflux transporter MFP subunit